MQTAAMLGSRILQVRTAKGLKIQPFAAAIGVSRTYLAQVEKGRGKPSIEMILGIAEVFQDINRDWLLTGDGPMLRSDAPHADGAGGDARSVRAAALSAERQLVDDLGIAEVALMNRLSCDPDTWRVLNALERAFPNGITIAQLASYLAQGEASFSHERMAAILCVAMAKKLVVQVGEAEYKAAGEIVQLESVGPPNVEAHMADAIRELARHVLPDIRAGKPGAVMVTSRVSVPRGSGDAHIKAIIRNIHDSLGSAVTPHGEEEIAFVVGATLTEKSD